MTSIVLFYITCRAKEIQFMKMDDEGGGGLQLPVVLTIDGESAGSTDQCQLEPQDPGYWNDSSAALRAALARPPHKHTHTHKDRTSVSEQLCILRIVGSSCVPPSTTPPRHLQRPHCSDTIYDHNRETIFHQNKAACEVLIHRCVMSTECDVVAWWLPNTHSTMS